MNAAGLLSAAALCLGALLHAPDANALVAATSGEVLSTEFGITASSKDNTAAINRWLAHCNDNKVACRLAPVEKGALLACGIVIPGPDTLLQGPGMGGVKLTATANCNQDFITVPPAKTAGQRPVIRDLWINCANYSNTKGHCIHLPDDQLNEYGVGIDLVNVYVDRAAEDALHVGRNRGAGLLHNAYLYHYKGTGLHLESSDWNCMASNFSGNHAPGKFADYGVRIVAGSNSTFVNCRSYNNRIGLATEYASTATPLTWLGGDLSNNARNGARIDSAGFMQGVVLSGVRFSENSMEATNTHADIVLSRNAGALIVNNIFQRSGKTVSKYLIETVEPAGPAIVQGNLWNATVPKYQPFGTAVSNDFANVPVPATDSGFVCSSGPGTYANRWSLACGYGSNASGKYAAAIGRQNTAAADHAVALGAGAVVRRPAMAYSNGSFSAPGDAQAIVVDMLTGITNDARTPVRLTSDRAAPGPANTLNLATDFRKLVLRDITITASNPLTADVASWTLHSLILTRGRGPASVQMLAPASPLTPAGHTADFSGLAAPRLSADDSQGGLAVSVVGKEGTVLRWMFSARAQELQ